jgi:hypothetical protein
LNTTALDPASLVSLDPIAVRLDPPVEREVSECFQADDARDLDPAALLALDPMAVRPRARRERREWRRPATPWIPSYAANALPRAVLLVPVLAVMVVILGEAL